MLMLRNSTARDKRRVGNSAQNTTSEATQLRAIQACFWGGDRNPIYR